MRGFALEKSKFSAGDSHRLVRRDHVNAIALDRRAVQNFRDGNFREAGKNFRQNTVVRGIEVRNEHIGHSCFFRQAGQQFLERFEPAGRSADSDDGK